MKHFVKEIKCRLCNCKGKGCPLCDGRGFFIVKETITETQYNIFGEIKVRAKMLWRKIKCYLTQSK